MTEKTVLEVPEEMADEVQAMLATIGAAISKAKESGGAAFDYAEVERAIASHGAALRTAAMRAVLAPDDETMALELPSPKDQASGPPSPENARVLPLDQSRRRRR